jgi:hypothetical protein
VAIDKFLAKVFHLASGQSIGSLVQEAALRRDLTFRPLCHEQASPELNDLEVALWQMIVQESSSLYAF